MLFASLPAEVRLLEVGPRDGLQNEKVVVDTHAKLGFLADLKAAGCRRIEATAFVNPRWIPALADHSEIAQATARAPLTDGDGVVWSALVPNVKGYETARQAGVGAIAVFLAATESHNKKNINASTSEAFARYAEVTARARADGVNVRGYVSCAFGCPYEGEVPLAAVTGVASRLVELGCDEISIGDTIGVGNPKQTVELVRALRDVVALERIALHLHDTRGTALANIAAALEEGIRSFDSSAGGLGGCPYAPGAAGNVATEDLVFMLEGMGVKTGIELEKLARASLRLEAVLGRPLPSKVLATLRGRVAV